MDIKKTLQNANIAQADFARMIGRPRQQVYYWCNKGISDIWETNLRTFFKRRNIEIIEKE